jgi:hypothetical protein
MKIDYENRDKGKISDIYYFYRHNLKNNPQYKGVLLILEQLLDDGYEGIVDVNNSDDICDYLRDKKESEPDEFIRREIDSIMEQI